MLRVMRGMNLSKSWYLIFSQPLTGLKTLKMFQLYFSSNKQKSLNIILYQDFICIKKYPEPDFFPNLFRGI
jgi:hypothetical protein